ncbi:MAG TPA: LamG-like jellyroll fold domain-containing protein [Planctomycetota bacterium]|nr:LamG-like jellyroll fold domain-containing protein [Planctomycetota bacterium]
MAHLRRRRAGMTLLEILTVIIIFSVLLAFSVMFLRNANRDLGVNASANTVQSVLRGAHQVARSNSAPAWVVLNVPSNTVYVLAKETVGEWHLEDASGAFGRNATISGGATVPGRVGQGVRLSGSGTIQCGEVPVYAPDQGVAIELWYQRKRGGRGILCTIGEQAEVASEADGRVTARVGAVNVASGNVRVPVDAWCYLQLVYSGRDLRLLLNRAPVGSAAGRGAWTPGGSLVVGDGRNGFNGIVDEIRLSLIVPRDAVPLASECVLDFPQGFVVPPDGEVVIAFDGEGRLDPALHAAPVRFGIKSPADRRDIVVGLSGTLLK